MLTQKTPLKRTAFVRSRKEASKDRAVRIKRKKKAASIWRSTAWLAVVRSLPCMCCGIANLTQAAHSNQLRFGKGRGLKASDASAMALCGPASGRNGCHATHDQGGRLTKTEWKTWENTMIIATIGKTLETARARITESVVDLSELSKIIIARIPDETDINTEALANFLVQLIESGELAPS